MSAGTECRCARSVRRCVLAVDGVLPEGFPREKTPRYKPCPTTGISSQLCKCSVCIGRRNRRKGKRGQHANRRVLEAVSGTQASWAGKLANEETADWLPVRYENKAGKAGGANAIWAAYEKCELQSDVSRAIGDSRPFMATFSPDGVGDGLVVIRSSKLAEVVSALVNGWQK